MAFITFPYVARVLEVERIGLVNFVDNTVNYFLLFASMGMGLLGVREIAAVKNDHVKRNEVFWKLMGVNLLFTFITLIVYFCLIFIVPTFRQYSELFYIGSAKILFTVFIAEWFFNGIEDFKYIAIRTVLIRAIYVVLVFCLIKSAADYKLYFMLTVATVVLNAVVNSVYLMRFIKIDFSSAKKLHYLKENCVLGIYSFMTSMYLTFNVMFLGFVCGNVQVGYYTTAFKIYTVTLGLFSAFTNVMLPRMSALLAQGEQEQFHKMIEKSFRAMFTFSVPIIVISLIMAPQVVDIIAGAGYEGSIAPMRILMPAVVFVGISQVLAMQVLVPMKRDKQLYWASMLGAIVSLVINVTAVWWLKSSGSALVLLMSEMSAALFYILYVSKRRLVKIPYDSFVKNLLINLPIVVVCLIAQSAFHNPFVSITLALAGSLICWICIKKMFNKKSYLI